jgi:hypothetical protein
MKHEMEFITSMFTKKNVQENALLDVSDEELAQYSGGGIVGSLPVVGPLAGPVVAPVGDLLSQTSIGVASPIADLAIKPGGLGAIL